MSFFDSISMEREVFMEKILYSEILVVCSMVLLIVWQSDIKRSRGPVLLGQKIFHFLIWINISAMFFDFIQIIYDSTNYIFSHEIEQISIFCYYVLHSLVAYVFLLYVDFELYPDNQRFQKRFPYYSIPTLIIIIACVCIHWTEWFFIVDRNNHYERGAYFYIPTLVSLGYVLYIFYMMICFRAKTSLDTNVQKNLLHRLIIFPIVPCVGAILQILLPGSTWTFPGTTLAILINYISIQNGYMARDHLTGLYNRGQLENFINYELKNIKEGHYFFLILLDLDKFKAINDTFGHVVGDDALINAAKILRGSCKRKADYVARLGGDEFVIIGQCENKEVVDQIVQRMHDVADEFNIYSKKQYKLQFSAGYVIYDGSKETTLDKLISEADKKMYEIKKAKKAKEKKEKSSNKA